MLQSFSDSKTINRPIWVGQDPLRQP